VSAPTADDIARLLEAKQPRRALAAALDIWRRSRSVTVASFIERLDHRTPAPASTEPSDRDAFQEAWLARAARPTNPEDIGWLARTLVHKLPPVKSDYYHHPPRMKHAPLFARLAALARLPADPRVAAAVARIVMDGKLTENRFSAEHNIYTGCFDVLVQIADPRQAEPLANLIEKPQAPTEHVRTYLAGALPDLVAKLSAIPHDEPPDRAAWEALCPPPAIDATQRATADRLLDAVLDDPEDLELRSVCADALQAIDDPRGELIALQLQPKKDPETRRRIRELLAAHAKAWLGDDLSLVLRAVEFRNGFPEVATLAPNHAAPEAVWKRALTDRRLATLAHLHKGNASKALHAKFVSSRAAKRLGSEHNFYDFR